jgi:alpha-L-glutamate ligase-related protein
MLKLIKKLSSSGVMGINKRNVDYIQKYNPRRFYPLVDDKLRTKQMAIDAGIAVPELYGVIEIEHQIRELPEFLKNYTDFALKPAQGAGGEGIEIIVGKVKNAYKRANGQLLTEEQLDHHVSNILNGLFSLGGHEDKAIIEYRVKFDPVFDDISYQGVPDVRIIVFMGFPVMAMIRLPTHRSGGKANLHQGAIGVGIDLATGRTMNAVIGNEIITEHPDTRNPVSGFEIPRWDELLTIAAKCYELSGLGYLGVDIVLDRIKGPLLLEMNARPGLSIQIANSMGLLHRLEYIEANGRLLACVEDRLAFSKKMVSRVH